MRRLATLLSLLVIGAAVSAPSVAVAHVEPASASTGAVSTPTPTTTGAPNAVAPDDPTRSVPGQAIPSGTDDSTTVVDALTILGFSIVAMAGLVLLIRAGLKSATREDVD